jgi:hypothetical protein
LLQSSFAVIAISTRINKNPDAYQIPDCEGANLAPDAFHSTNDFMAGHHGKESLAPLFATLMDIRVAYSGMTDGYLNIPSAQLPTFKVEWNKLLFWR